MKTVSVVIPARNSQDSIRPTINSLATQTRRPDEVVVVVARNDPTRTTIEDYLGFVQLLETSPPARFVRDAHWKRWTGAKVAKGDVVLFVDSGVIVEENAISKILELMSEYGVQVVGGIVPAWPEAASHFVIKVQDKGLVTNYPEFPEARFINRDNFGDSESLAVTGILGMTRRAFESIQDDFGVEFSSIAATYDDYVVDWLLVSRGITILVSNQVIGYRKPRLTLRGYAKEISRSGQSAAVMRNEYPECPFGKRRLFQTLAVWGLVAASLATAVLSLIAFGATALLVMTSLAVGGFFFLGVANAIKARDLDGFFIPPITIFLIFVFAFHFTKSWIWIRQNRLEPRKIQEYLQIR